MKPLTQLLLITVISGSLQTAQAEDRYRYSTAYAAGGDEILYTEEHIETFRDDTIIEGKVVYRDKNGIVFAEKNLNYRHNRYLPDFTLHNRPPGHQEIAAHRDGYYEVFYQNEALNEKDKKRLQPDSTSVADAGFDRFIIDHWDEILNGDTLRAGFLIPSMQEFVQFRIYQDSPAANTSAETRRIVVEPASFLVRLLADKIVLEYRYDEPVLKTFTGVSNLRDRNGDNYQVRIEFGDRRETLAERAEDE